MNAGDALKGARIRAGLTQHALAARAGTSQATISAYESGRKEPSLSTLDRLLTAAGAELAVVSSHRSVREPTRQQLSRAGRALRSVVELAEALPARHRPALEFPRLAGPKARTR
jgi:transcriptional regulator with XRE-family HTH domain